MSKTNLNKFSLLPSPKGEGQDEGIYITTFWDWYYLPWVADVCLKTLLIIWHHLGLIFYRNKTLGHTNATKFYLSKSRKILRLCSVGGKKNILAVRGLSIRLFNVGTVHAEQNNPRIGARHSQEKSLFAVIIPIPISSHCYLPQREKARMRGFI